MTSSSSRLVALGMGLTIRLPFLLENSNSCFSFYNYILFFFFLTLALTTLLSHLSVYIPLLSFNISCLGIPFPTAYFLVHSITSRLLLRTLLYSIRLKSLQTKKNLSPYEPLTASTAFDYITTDRDPGTNTEKNRLLNLTSWNRINTNRNWTSAYKKTTQK